MEARLPKFINLFTQQGTAQSFEPMHYVDSAKIKKMLTSRGFVPLEGLDTDEAPPLELAADTSAATASLSNLMDKKEHY